MKKKILFIILVFIIVLSLVLATGCAVSDEESGIKSEEIDSLENESEESVEVGFELSEGRAVKCEGNVYVIAYDDGSFLKMNAESQNFFEGLETGDLIVINRSSAIAMSYPGQCFVKSCQKLEDGDVSDVPKAIIDELVGIGWLIE